MGRFVDGWLWRYERSTLRPWPCSLSNAPSLGQPGGLRNRRTFGNTPIRRKLQRTGAQNTSLLAATTAQIIAAMADSARVLVPTMAKASRQSCRFFMALTHPAVAYGRCEAPPCAVGASLPANRGNASSAYPAQSPSPRPAPFPPLSAGEYKGKRERLSESLVSRFMQVAFLELPPEEWEQVVAARLRDAGLSSSLAANCAKEMVRTHMEVEQAVWSADKPFAEVGAPHGGRGGGVGARCKTQPEHASMRTRTKYAHACTHAHTHLRIVLITGSPIANEDAGAGQECRPALIS